MKPVSALWRLAIAVAVASALFVLMASIITNPTAGEARTYVADFTDASGLHADADVRVRGVRVGKVQSVELARRDKKNVAEVRLTLDKRYGVVPITRLAIKFQALTGLRYVDVLNPAEGAANQNVIAHVPTSMTQPSFDITALFNGLQPVLATLSPEDLNTFAANAASFLTGDGSGLAPLLDSLRHLTEFLTNRQEVIATLTSNLAQLSDHIGGSSRQFIHIIDLVNQPVDAALSALDELRKSQLYGPAFTEPVIRLLHNLGLRPGIDIDRAMDRAFTNLDNFFDAFKLVPVMSENVQEPSEEGTPEPCSHGPAQLPETMDVLLNGTRVVLCNP